MRDRGQCNPHGSWAPSKGGDGAPVPLDFALRYTRDLGQCWAPQTKVGEVCGSVTWHTPNQMHVTSPHALL